MEHDKLYNAILGSVLEFHISIILAFTDKVANNDGVISRMYFFKILKQELRSSVDLQK